MNTCTEVLRVAELSSTRSIATRETARRIVARARMAKCDDVVLDFSEIAFASMSCLDELNRGIAATSRPSIRLTNINTDIAHMLRLLDERAHAPADAPDRPHPRMAVERL